MKIVLCAAAVLLSAVAFGSDRSVSRVLGSIDIPADQTADDLSAVNGSVNVGARSHVAAINTVNGSLHLGGDAQAASMTTVNGSVVLDSNAHVAGKVSTTNGTLKLAPGAEVRGPLENVNGDISIDGAHVVGPGAVVAGALRFDREVALYISDRAQVTGPIEGATPIRYSGPTAPR